MLNIFLSAIVFLCIAVPAIGLEAQGLTIGQNVFSSVLSNKTSLKVIAIITDKTDCMTPEGWGWGAEEELPVVAISSVTVFLNNKKVFVPKSAYLDLGNPRNFVIKEQKQKIILEITGGDAATAYKAQLEITNELLRKRTVVSSEFPDDSGETTVYRYNME